MKTKNIKNKDSQIEFYKETAYGVMCIVKNSFSALFSAVWGLTGIIIFDWVLVFILKDYSMLIDFKLALNLVTYIYIPIYMIIFTIMDIKEYQSYNKTQTNVRR